MAFTQPHKAVTLRLPITVAVLLTAKAAKREISVNDLAIQLFQQALQPNLFKDVIDTTSKAAKAGLKNAAKSSKKIKRLKA